MLGWACERAGVAFRIVDRGHAAAASRIGAGLVSPLTGRRLVPTWRFGEWRDEALATYRALEQALGMPLVRELRLRRLYRDDAERKRFGARLDAPEVAAWVESVDDEGLWLRGAFQVDTAAVIAGLRERWWGRGWLEETTAAPAEGEPMVVWCTGADVGAVFPEVPWEPSLGQLLEGALDGLEPKVVRNDGQWLLPVGAGRARVGATFEREFAAVAPTTAGRAWLQAAARRLGGRELAEPIVASAGLRVTVPDRRPVVGWHPEQSERGVFAGLAAKGALWAPVLARQWVSGGWGERGLDPEARLERFWAKGSGVSSRGVGV